MSALDWVHMAISGSMGLVLMVNFYGFYALFRANRTHRADMKRRRWERAVYEVVMRLGPQVPQDVLAREVELQLRSYVANDDKSSDHLMYLCSLIILLVSFGIWWLPSMPDWFVIGAMMGAGGLGIYNTLRIRHEDL